MNIKQLFVLALGFPSCVFASPSIDQELVSWRLETMKSALNARDFDLASYRIHQMDVLSRACDLETKKARLPISCFELRHEQRLINAKSKKNIFRLTDLNDLDAQCIRVLETDSGKAQLRNFESIRKFEGRLSKNCLVGVRELWAIEKYKKTGRRIE